MPSLGEPGSPDAGFRSSQPAQPAAVRSLRRALRGWIRDRAIDEDTADAIVLLTDEAVTNAVEHAGLDQPCTVEVVAGVRGCGGGVAVQVRDDGVWRPQPEDRGFRGRGVTLMGRLADKSTITTSAEGTTVNMCWA